MNIEQTAYSGKNFFKATIYLAYLSDEEKKMLKIDQILALYLVDLAEHVIVGFYKSAAVFIELYRNCINEMGWDKLSNYKRLDDLAMNNDNDSLCGSGSLPPFSSVKDAELIPEFCNDFVVHYLPQKCNVFSKSLSVEFVKHLCIWLHNRGLTKLKLAMAD